MASAPGQNADRASASAADERTPLLDTKKAQPPEVESFEDIREEGVHFTYDTTKLITFRVFFQWTGTVLQSSMLWKETLSTFAIYIIVCCLVGSVRWDGYSNFVGKESTIRAFLSMFSNFIGLLLAFYTSMIIGRWWAMRMGTKDIWDGAAKLSMLLANGVTSDKTLLEAVHRYARASLLFIFCESQEVKNPTQVMLHRGIIDEDEAAQLNSLSRHGNFAQAFVPWAWLASAVTAIHKQGLTSGPPHLCALLAAVEQGRGGVVQIQTYVDTSIPKSYLHILGLIVKLHNFLLATFMGLICIMHVGGKGGNNYVAIFRTAFRAFFMPFLYNALLIANVDLSNPFSGDVGDLPFAMFDAGISGDASTLAEAHQHRPGWLKDHKFAAWAP